MEINDEMIKRLADLAKLEFDDHSRKAIREDLSRILDFVEQLQKVDTEGVEPLIYMNDDKNVLRKDEAQATITHEEALLNAPQKDSDYFKVPKVLGGEGHSDQQN